MVGAVAWVHRVCDWCPLRRYWVLEMLWHGSSPQASVMKVCAVLWVSVYSLLGSVLFCCAYPWT